MKGENMVVINSSFNHSSLHTGFLPARGLDSIIVGIRILSRRVIYPYDNIINTGHLNIQLLRNLT